MSGVGVAKVAQILDLCNVIPQMELKGHRIMIRDVNRPALQLSGYFEHFEQSRVQIIGTVEYTYLQQLDEKKKEMRDWYESLIEMMSYEGVEKKGHLQLNKNVIIDLYICVKHGMRIPAVALQLQEAVKEDIFQYTGITVAEVNVNVQQIVFGAAR